MGKLAYICPRLVSPETKQLIEQLLLDCYNLSSESGKTAKFP
ncbi:hypothetical protein N0824_01745 [Microcystis sp. 0824]|nr:hypothetical protein N0824_01745 [Microcystis sp. 0824]